MKPSEENKVIYCINWLGVKAQELLNLYISSNDIKALYEEALASESLSEKKYPAEVKYTKASMPSDDDDIDDLFGTNDEVCLLQALAYMEDTTGEHIKRLPLSQDEKTAQIEASDYLALRMAAQNGNLNLFRHFKEFLTADEVRAAFGYIKEMEWNSWGGEDFWQYPEVIVIELLEKYFSADLLRQNKKFKSLYKDMLNKDSGYVDALIQLDRMLTPDEREQGMELIIQADILSKKIKRNDLKSVRYICSYLSRESVADYIRNHKDLLKDLMKYGPLELLIYLESFLIPETIIATLDRLDDTSKAYKKRLEGALSEVECLKELVKDNNDSLLVDVTARSTTTQEKLNLINHLFVFLNEEEKHNAIKFHFTKLVENLAYRKDYDVMVYLYTYLKRSELKEVITSADIKAAKEHLALLLEMLASPTNKYLKERFTTEMRDAEVHLDKVQQILSSCSKANADTPDETVRREEAYELARAERYLKPNSYHYSLRFFTSQEIEEYIKEKDQAPEKAKLMLPSQIMPWGSGLSTEPDLSLHFDIDEKPYTLPKHEVIEAIKSEPSRLEALQGIMKARGEDVLDYPEEVMVSCLRLLSADSLKKLTSVERLYVALVRKGYMNAVHQLESMLSPLEVRECARWVLKSGIIGKDLKSNQFIFQKFEKERIAAYLAALPDSLLESDFLRAPMHFGELDTLRFYESYLFDVSVLESEGFNSEQYPYDFLSSLKGASLDEHQKRCVTFWRGVNLIKNEIRKHDYIVLTEVTTFQKDRKALLKHIKHLFKFLTKEEINKAITYNFSTEVAYKSGSKSVLVENLLSLNAYRVIAYLYEQLTDENKHAIATQDNYKVFKLLSERWKDLIQERTCQHNLGRVVVTYNGNYTKVINLFKSILDALSEEEKKHILTREKGFLLYQAKQNLKPADYEYLLGFLTPEDLQAFDENLKERPLASYEHWAIQRQAEIRAEEKQGADLYKQMCRNKAPSISQSIPVTVFGNKGTSARLTAETRVDEPMCEGTSVNKHQ